MTLKPYLCRFNHASLTDMLPRFYLHVTTATRGNNILDKVYTNRKDSYKSTPVPYLGLSDHISIMMVPASQPVLKNSKPVQKTITLWPDDTACVLQDCIGYTDWQISGKRRLMNERWIWRSMQHQSLATSVNASVMSLPPGQLPSALTRSHG